MRRRIIITGSVVIAIIIIVIIAVMQSSRKNTLNDGVQPYIEESSSVEQTSANFEQDYTEPESEIITEESVQEETLTFRVEVPEPATVNPIQIESGYTYDDYSDEEAIVAKYLSDLGYSDFIIVSSSLMTDGDSGLEVPSWMVSYLGQVDTMYSIICTNGSRLAAIYYKGQVICAEDDTED